MIDRMTTVCMIILGIIAIAAIVTPFYFMVQNDMQRKREVRAAMGQRVTVHGKAGIVVAMDWGLAVVLLEDGTKIEMSVLAVNRLAGVEQ